MEAVSKNRRGRPTKLEPDRMGTFARIFTQVHTRRGLENIYYRDIAFSHLKDDPAFLWLCDWRRIAAGKPHAWKAAILSELGRLEDPELIQSIGAQLCELKPKTKEAVAMVRNYRLGERTPDPVRLANEVVGVVNNFVTRFPAATDVLIGEALEMAMTAVKERGRHE